MFIFYLFVMFCYLSLFPGEYLVLTPSSGLDHMDYLLELDHHSKTKNLHRTDKSQQKQAYNQTKECVI